MGILTVFRENVFFLLPGPLPPPFPIEKHQLFTSAEKLYQQLSYVNILCIVFPAKKCQFWSAFFVHFRYFRFNVNFMHGPFHIQSTCCTSSLRCEYKLLFICIPFCGFGWLLSIGENKPLSRPTWCNYFRTTVHNNLQIDRTLGFQVGIMSGAARSHCGGYLDDDRFRWLFLANEQIVWFLFLIQWQLQEE